MYINQLTNTITFCIWYLCHLKIRLAHKKYTAFLWKLAPLRIFTVNCSSPGLKLWDCFHVVPLHHCPCQYQFTTTFSWMSYCSLLLSFTPMPGISMGKNPPDKAGDVGLIPGSGWSPEEGNGNPLQYSCLGNPKDRGPWRAAVHDITKELDMTEWLNNNKTCLH